MSTRSRRRGRGRSRRRRRGRGRGSSYGFLILPVALATVLAGGFAFLVLRTKAKGESQEAICSLIIDRTVLTGDPAAAAVMKTAARSAIDGCRAAKASLAIFRVDQAAATPAGQYQLWKSPKRKASQAQKQVDEQVSAATKAVDGMAGGPAPAQAAPHLLAALQSPARELGDTPLKRYLVVVTNGRQTSADISIDSIHNPSDDVAPLVATATKDGLIPPVKDAQVDMFFVRQFQPQGATEAVQDWLPKKIHLFWQQIFAGGGAQRMCSVGPGATLPSKPSSTCEQVTDA